MHRILIVEDDITLGSGIRLALQTQDVQCELSHSLKDARSMLEKTLFDLLLLDINLDIFRSVRCLTLNCKKAYI